ncbi:MULTISPECIES: DNA mismatch repair protein MutS [Fusobacterium]|uniref:DNA mismatch repair protein MutS n=1 Tax=Fusobacterium varium ATCC 27725 TaxID=469618 RepID=A0ABM6U4R7_FUSVA|nr:MULTISPECIES: DNA mismatch repair protein MutS [Fusobacterium]AVQ31281.1 DNA mismatch repair protein MutS [Fusobacterium varium ATCC 27725]EES62602.1 DNA mismatch repair protein MutS [Fusobacterium varium ATCC 27725]MCF0170074.1 DNA mismatch repair protein MutS [Fusobacterium varium]MCF2672573.1 DNA mismatch repair protein MutS [Fusobacterium varium]MCI6032560.1 DNA mismatch repair protein MutS [Fusobacterium varium]
MAGDTPLMSQYKEIKEQNKDNLLFFRLGDFYEMFFDDAVIASKELGLTLTSRNREKGQDVPLAGVPYHSVSSYIAKLVNKGYKVAICEQVEDPKSVKGIVKREVVRVITPGTVIDTDYLDEKSNNYLMGIKIDGNKGAIAYVDITTGEFKASELEGEDIIFKLLGEINKIAPKEILLEEKTYDKYYEELKKHNTLSDVNISKITEKRKCEDYLKDYFKVISLESFGLKDRKMAIVVSATILNYVVELQKGKELPVNNILYTSSENIMELNITTQRNLDIVDNYREKNGVGTLLWVMDECMTSMGSRLLKKFIKNPLLDIEKINERQKDIAFFIENVLLREEIREKLKSIYDIERIIGKLILETENGRDLISLKISIKNSLEILKLLQGNSIFSIEVKTLIDIYNLIEKTIVDEPPFSVREGGIIRQGYNEMLDELHGLSKDGKDYILEIENRERERTGIKGLKIKYNKVFGYFIEVTRANAHLVPADYIRKQTLANAERYIVPDLKEYEEKVLNAKDKIENLEYQLFKEVAYEIKSHKEILQDLAYKIAYLDVASDLAHIAIKNSYVQPEIHAGKDIEIIAGRHPIVEKLIPAGEYVKNNIVFDDNKEMIILTGPNMSGKSTYMKQVALIIIMAHMGSYVPANYAKIGLVDKIFTRIGASDDLLTGQSTFMLEMSEVANIVNSATNRSFIILDEIGRGTSTFDGISIATAITEYIHERIGAKTIFATHYHELTQLEDKLDRAENYRIEVKENDKEIVFLREIVKGGADKSYGIEVARLAGLPKEILDRSKSVLKNLEDRKQIIEKKLKGEQLILFGTPQKEESTEEEKNNLKGKELTKEQKIVMRVLEELDPNGMTPLEALLKLNELKKILNRS